MGKDLTKSYYESTLGYMWHPCFRISGFARQKAA